MEYRIRKIRFGKMSEDIYVIEKHVKFLLIFKKWECLYEKTPDSNSEYLLSFDNHSDALLKLKTIKKQNGVYNRRTI